MPDLSLLLLRVVIAAIFYIHAIPKISKPKTTPFFRGLGMWEAAFATLMLSGVLAQYAAVALSAVMIGALYMKIVKWNVPFKTDKGTGWELDAVILAANSIIYSIGPGAYTL